LLAPSLGQVGFLDEVGWFEFHSSED
jgi:hypothetical protein